MGFVSNMLTAWLNQRNVMKSELTLLPLSPFLSPSLFLPCFQLFPVSWPSSLQLYRLFPISSVERPVDPPQLSPPRCHGAGGFLSSSRLLNVRMLG